MAETDFYILVIWYHSILHFNMGDRKIIHTPKAFHKQAIKLQVEDKQVKIIVDNDIFDDR
jgi:hypothetical protein